jgi:integrase
MRGEEARGVSGKTYNDTLKLFRSCFRNLSREAGIAENPFAGISTKDADTIHRHPFSEEELDAIIEASKSDPQAHDLIVTAACTAMRLGDVARLRWENVDLEENFIDVKTSKTGETATIPIFARLRSVLTARRVCREGYVFPELEKQYSVAPDVLTRRVRKAMRAAGFGDPGIERGNGEPTRGAFHKPRKVGIRQASIRDIHSLRLTWVTIALNSGVPVNLVQKVTGHTTVEIVLKHYYRPGREDLKQELEKRLPAALTGTPVKAIAAKDSLRDKLTSMTADNWQLVRDELLKDLGRR